jgi:hypothetical protein
MSVFRRVALLAAVTAAPLVAQAPALKKTTPWVDGVGGVWYHREPVLANERAVDRLGTAGALRIGRRANPGATHHYVLSASYGTAPEATLVGGGVGALDYTQWAVSAGVENESDFGPARLGLGVELGWGSFRETVGAGSVPSGTRLNTSSNLVIVPTVTLRDRFGGPIGLVLHARFPQLVQGIGGGNSPFRPHFMAGFSIGR